MTKFYDDSRYGVEKILTFPGVGDLSDAAGNIAQTGFDGENIELIEFGIVVVNEAITATSVCTVQLRVGSTVLASITVPSLGALGTLVTTKTLTTNLIASGDNLLFYRNITTGGIGEVMGYVRYKERYV